MSYNDDNYDSLLSGVALQASSAHAPAYQDNNNNISSSSNSNLSDQSYQGYTPQEPAPFNIQSIQLPPPQMGCYQPPGNVQGQVQHRKGQETNETKNIDQTLNDTKTATRENVVHHQHVKNVVYNVNRTHNHLVKVVNRDNNYHHHLINNVVRVNDIHNERVEEVRGEGRTSRDYKQTHRVEAGTCRRGTSAAGGGYSGQAQYGAAAAATAGWQQQQQQQQYSQQWQQPQQQYANYGSANYGSANYGSANYGNAGYRRY